MQAARTPRAQTHRERYALLLAAIFVVFGIEGIAQPSGFEQVLVSVLLGVTMLLSLWAAEAKPVVIRSDWRAVLAVSRRASAEAAAGNVDARRHAPDERGARRARARRRSWWAWFAACAPARR